MKSTAKQLSTAANWPPEKGQIISLRSFSHSKRLFSKKWVGGSSGEISFLTASDTRAQNQCCPQPQAWRKNHEVTDLEREKCEERLLSMARAGMDPRERDQSFWAELERLSGVHIPEVQTGRVQTARHGAMTTDRELDS